MLEMYCELTNECSGSNSSVNGDYQIFNERNELVSSHQGRKYVVVTKTEKIGCCTRMLMKIMGSMFCMMSLGLSLCYKPFRSDFTVRKLMITYKVSIPEGHTAQETATLFNETNRIKNYEIIKVDPVDE
jgi:hypothetical protein